MNCDKYGKDRDEEERQEKETCSKSRCTSDRDAVNMNPLRESATHLNSTSASNVWGRSNSFNYLVCFDSDVKFNSIQLYYNRLYILFIHSSFQNTVIGCLTRNNRTIEVRYKLNCQFEKIKNKVN